MDSLKKNSLKNYPDFNGKFGEYGGRFVAETLMPLIIKVEESYEKAIINYFSLSLEERL